MLGSVGVPAGEGPLERVRWEGESKHFKCAVGDTGGECRLVPLAVFFSWLISGIL
jgi:hypothetical protein